MNDMRHLLMDPSFPDIVGEWAIETIEEAASPFDHANDNLQEALADLSEELLICIAEAEIAATRLW
jgi:hypothetical protein